ncbi:MAG: alpha-1,2-fucosyltransferase [Phycisphaerae bacterium]
MSERTIHIIINGGLGNQLFQYAAGVYFAQAWQAKLRLYTPGDEGWTREYPRPYRLAVFNLPQQACPSSLFARLVRSQRYDQLPGGRWLLRILSGAHVINEFDTHGFTPADHFPIPGHNVWMLGYWQAAGYPQTVADTLRQHLTFASPATGRNEELLHTITQQSYAVSLHIRRGDYQLVGGGHLLLPLSYYHRAMARLSEHVPNPHFYVFSDDIAWARANLPTDCPTTFVDHNDQHHGFEDLRLMSACRHHIIANSSFSWWGAWLGKPDASVTLAPAPWVPGRPVKPAIYPSGWQIINYQ